MGNKLLKFIGRQFRLEALDDEILGGLFHLDRDFSRGIFIHVLRSRRLPFQCSVELGGMGRNLK